MSSSSRIVIKPRIRNSEVFLSTSSSVEEFVPPKETIDENPTETQSNVVPYAARSPLLNRIIVLKNIQLEHTNTRAQYFNELFQLEMSYQSKLVELCERRQHIINGTYGTHVGFRKGQVGNSTELSQEVIYPRKRLPQFWLGVLLQTPVVKNMIKGHDIPALQALNDLRVHYNHDRSFTIEFHFDRNDYFANSVLKKKYYQIATIDPEDPFGYDGPEIYRAEGCAIYWKKGKNLTYFRNKEDSGSNSSLEFPVSNEIVRQARRYIESFFHFFNPPQFPVEKVVVDMELERVLTIDFEIGNFLRKRVIPSAITFYLKLFNLENNADYSEMEVKGEGLVHIK